MREWFEDRQTYHKVGYLVAIDTGLEKLLGDAELKLPKSGFRTFLDEKIKASLDLDAETARGLTYGANSEKCERLLLLFNVESVRRLEHSSERYPFHSHKKEKWSLEHIDAQHADPLQTEREWRLWLDDSKRALASLRLENGENEARKQEVLVKIDGVLAGRISGPQFKTLSRLIMELDFLRPTGVEDAVHSITNLALLSSSVNSALNNAAFYAKRLRVIELDREGKFIPISTRRAFFKYYTEAGSQQMYLWSREDQSAYMDHMLSPKLGIGSYLKPTAEVLS